MSSSTARPRPEEIKEHSYGVIPVALSSPPTVLLIQQKSDSKHWGIPKGHADAGETPLQAAIRELEEETGLHATRFLPAAPSSYPSMTSSTSSPSGMAADAIDADGDSIQGEPYRNPRRNDGWKQNYYFLGLFNADAAKDTALLRLQEEEVEQAAWLEFDEAAERCTFDEGRQVIREAQSRLQSHGIR
ncbi:hypothetical protein OC835_001228 [Tilletia horrida]|nr:hypothetical protein OC835_001228 [Tilletia horrida]